MSGTSPNIWTLSVALDWLAADDTTWGSGNDPDIDMEISGNWPFIGSLSSTAAVLVGGIATIAFSDDLISGVWIWLIDHTDPLAPVPPGTAFNFSPPTYTDPVHGLEIPTVSPTSTVINANGFYISYIPTPADPVGPTTAGCNVTQFTWDPVSLTVTQGVTRTISFVSPTFSLQPFVLSDTLLCSVHSSVRTLWPITGGVLQPADTAHSVATQPGAESVTLVPSSSGAGDYIAVIAGGNLSLQAIQPDGTVGSTQYMFGGDAVIPPGRWLTWTDTATTDTFYLYISGVTSGTGFPPTPCVCEVTVDSSGTFTIANTWDVAGIALPGDAEAASLAAIVHGIAVVPTWASEGVMLWEKASHTQNAAAGIAYGDARSLVGIDSATQGARNVAYSDPLPLAYDPNTITHAYGPVIGAAGSLGFNGFVAAPGPCQWGDDYVAFAGYVGDTMPLGNVLDVTQMRILVCEPSLEPFSHGQPQVVNPSSVHLTRLGGGANWSIGSILIAPEATGEPIP